METLEKPRKILGKFINWHRFFYVIIMCKTKFAPVGLLCLFMALFFAVPQVAVAQTVTLDNLQGTYGTIFTGNVEAEGTEFTGTTFTWSISDGALPTGLTLNETSTASTTTISGTPTVVGSSFTFKIKAIDNDGIEAEESFTIEIGKATLTVTANNDNIAYGDAVPSYSISDVTISGFKLSDDKDNNDFTGTFAIGTDYTQGAATGSYDITPSGWTSGNYDIDFQDGTLTVGKATLTVTAKNANIEFGSPNPISSYNNSNATITGFKLSDDEDNNDFTGTLAFTTDYTTSSAVGTTPYIRPSAGTLTSNNYGFNFVDGAFTILKATPVCGSIANLPATEGQTLADVSLSGLTCGSVAGSFTWDDDTQGVGTAATSPNGPFAATFTPSGPDANNYNTASVSITIDVSAAPSFSISLTPNQGTYGVSYTGTLTATGFTGIHAWSQPSGDLPDDLDLNASTTATTTISGTPGKAGSFTFTIKVEAGSDEKEQSFTITIAKATPVCTVADVLTAEENQPLSTVLLTGLDGPTLCGGVAGSFAWLDDTQSVGTAGNGKTFNATFTPSGSDANNYNTASVSINIDVSAAPTITVDAISIENPLDKPTYTQGETLELDGLVVKLTYDDGTYEDITYGTTEFTNKISTAPAHGSLLNTVGSIPVEVSSKAVPAVKTTFNVTVNTNVIATAAISMAAPATSMPPPTKVDVTPATPEKFEVTSVSWNSTDNPFQANTQYTVTIELTAKSVYTFTGLASATINGDSVIPVPTPTNAGKNITFSYQFPATTAGTPFGIEVTAQPSDMNYKFGDTLNTSNKLSDLEVTIKYSVGGTYDPTLDETLSYAQFKSKGGSVMVEGGTSGATLAMTDNTKRIRVLYNTLEAFTTKTLTVTEIEIATPASIKITKPVTGATLASTTATANNGPVNFDISNLTWSTTPPTTSTTFLPGTVYTAEVTLTPKTGYKFPMAFFAAIDSATTTVIDGTAPGTKKLSGVFPATGAAPITAVNIAIDTPIVNTTPVTTATGTPQFTVDSVTWNPDHDSFRSSTAYTVTVKLKAVSGNTFTGLLPGDAKINGKQANIVTGSNLGTEIKLSFTFSATPAKSVADIAVETPPAKMVYDFNESLKLDSLVVLMNYDDGTTDTVKAGYAGKGLTITLANGNKGNPLKMEDNGQAIRIMYDTTKGIETATGPITVNKIKIKNAIITVVEPANGGIPNTVANAGPGFTASPVFWSPTDNPYKPLTKYTAKVSLAVNEGYELVMPLDTATINDSAATVTNNPDGTITLSYEFPETLATPSLVVTKIAIKTQPINMIYTHGDQLDLSGLEVTFTYSDNRTEDITLSSFASKRITTNPINGALLTSSAHNNARVEVTYTYNKTNLRTYTDNLIVLKKVVPTIVIAGKNVAMDSTDDKKFTFVSKCGETDVNIDISQEDAEIVVNGGNIGINQNVISASLDYGDNPFNIAVTPDVGAREVYTLTVKKPFPADSLIQIRWGNTLTVIDNTRYNSYEFTNYKWYRNDREVGSGRSWSTGAGEKLNPRDKYFVEAITEDGKSIRSCEVALTAATMQAYGILLKNNPAYSNIGIDVSAPEETSEMEIAVYNISGKLVFSQKGNYNFNWNLTDAMHRNVSNGMYIVTAKAKGESGKIYRYSAKFVVKR